MLSHYSVNYFSSYFFFVKEYITVTQQTLSYKLFLKSVRFKNLKFFVVLINKDNFKINLSIVLVSCKIIFH